MSEKKQKQKKQEIELPLGLSLRIFTYMKHTAKEWKNEGNVRAAQDIERSIRNRRKGRKEFIIEHKSFIIMEDGKELVEEKSKEKKQAKTKKKKVREYRGDTKSELIEQAIKALTPKYNDREGPDPTSIELFKDYARIWFEFDGDEDPDNIIDDWEYSMTAPIYYFWGRKKREKYLKENRHTANWKTIKQGEIVLAEYRPLNNGFEGRVYTGNVLHGFYVDSIEEIHVRIRNIGPTSGWEDKIRINDFFMNPQEHVIIMPFNMDQTRLIKLNQRTFVDFDHSYIIYSGSRYGENRNTHAHVYNTKDGYDFMVKILIDWYS